MYDGDMLAVGLMLDLAIWERAKRLQPHTGTLDLNSPRKIANNLKFHTPVLSMVSNWLSKAPGRIH